MLQTAFGRCMYRSEYGHEVWQNFFYRWLTFSSEPIQSIINRRYPHKPATACVRTLRYAAMQCPGSTLHLGLGGACTAHALSPYRQGHEWTFVELDAEVIAIAKHFFQLDRLKPFQLIHNDASLFIRKDKNEYQHIIIDLADAEQFPQSCATPDFFENCAARLQSSGILAINLPDPMQHKPISQMLHSILPSQVILNVSGMTNIVILCSKIPSNQQLMESLKLAAHCKFLSWQNEWGMVGELKTHV